MKKLQDNWLTEGFVDFEYKKYILLAYLQSVKQEFEFRKLYPTFSDLLFHYKNLLTIRDNKQLLYQSFPKEISHADFKKLQLSYKQIVEDSEVMKELTDIVLYAIPHFEEMIEDAKGIYEHIEQSLAIEPIGISPLYPDEGYVFMQQHLFAETLIYRYQLSIFESATERFRGLHLHFLESVRRGLGQTYEGIKLDLIRRYQALPTPAAYLIVAKVPCPFEESLLPIAKRLLMKELAGNMRA